MVQITTPDRSGRTSGRTPVGPNPASGVMNTTEIANINKVNREFEDKVLDAVNRTEENEAYSSAIKEISSRVIDRQSRLVNEDGSPGYTTLVSDVEAIVSEVSKQTAGKINSADARNNFNNRILGFGTNVSVQSHSIARNQQLKDLDLKTKKSLLETREAAAMGIIGVPEAEADMAKIINDAQLSGLYLPEAAAKLMEENQRGLINDFYMNAIESDAVSTFDLLSNPESATEDLGLTEASRADLLDKARKKMSEDRKSRSFTRTALKENLQNKVRSFNSGIIDGLDRGVTPVQESVNRRRSLENLRLYSNTDLERETDRVIRSEMMSDNLEMAQFARTEINKLNEAERRVLKDTLEVEKLTKRAKAHMVLEGRLPESLFTDQEVNKVYSEELRVINSTEVLAGRPGANIIDKTLVVAKLGRIPSDYLQDISRATRFGNSESNAQMNQAYRALKQTNPEVVGKLPEDTVAWLATYDAYLLGTGDQATAFENTKESLRGRTDQDAQILTKEYFRKSDGVAPRDNLIETLLEGVQTRLEGPLLSFFGDIDPEDLEPNARAFMERIAKNAFIKAGGDTDLAVDIATPFMMRALGPTEMRSGRREGAAIMMFPPEKHFPKVNPDTLQDNFDTMMAPVELPPGVDRESLFIVSDELTATRPTYQVRGFDRSGAEVVITDPKNRNRIIRWAPTDKELLDTATRTSQTQKVMEEKAKPITKRTGGGDILGKVTDEFIDDVVSGTKKLGEQMNRPTIDILKDIDKAITPAVNSAIKFSYEGFKNLMDWLNDESWKETGSSKTPAESVQELKDKAPTTEEELEEATKDQSSSVGTLTLSLVNDLVEMASGTADASTETPEMTVAEKLEVFNAIPAEDIESMVNQKLIDDFNEAQTEADPDNIDIELDRIVDDATFVYREKAQSLKGAPKDSVAFDKWYRAKVNTPEFKARIFEEAKKNADFLPTVAKFLQGNKAQLKRIQATPIIPRSVAVQAIPRVDIRDTAELQRLEVSPRVLSTPSISERSFENDRFLPNRVKQVDNRIADMFASDPARRFHQQLQADSRDILSSRRALELDGALMAQSDIMKNVVDGGKEPGSVSFKERLPITRNLIELAKLTYPNNPAIQKVAVAQALGESKWLSSVNANRDRNLFGIKTNRKQKGKGAVLSTKEQVGSKLVSTKDEFMVYDSFVDSFNAHRELLVKLYPKVFSAKTPEEVLVALQPKGKNCDKEGGPKCYATDANYKSKIMSVVNGNVNPALKD